MNIKNVIGLSILVCVGMYSLPSRAQSNNSTSSVATESESANFGIYSWDESSQAWILLYSGYDEYYASEVMGADDYQVDPIPVSGGGLGGGMYDELPQGLRAQAPVAMAKDKDEKEEEPKNFETMVVTGVRPSMLGGSALSVVWNRFGNLFGQRSTSTKTVPAPKK